MPYLVAAVVVVGLLCTIDLLFTVGVVRRLREHSDLLAAGHGRGMAPGSDVGPFSAVDVDGREVTRELLAGETLVGFFSPGCGSCEELLPRFAARAAGESEVLAVVQGTEQERTEMVAALSAVARVVVEDLGEGEISQAFGVRGFPAVYRVAAGGRVLSMGPGLPAEAPSGPARV